jgi:hypothetical protein
METLSRILLSYTLDSAPYSKPILFFNGNSCGELDLAPSISVNIDIEKFHDAIKLKSAIVRNNNSFLEKDQKVWFLNPSASIRSGTYNRKIANTMCKNQTVKTVDQYEKGDIFIYSPLFNQLLQILKV